MVEETLISSNNYEIRCSISLNLKAYIRHVCARKKRLFWLFPALISASTSFLSPQNKSRIQVTWRERAFVSLPRSPPVNLTVSLSISFSVLHPTPALQNLFGFGFGFGEETEVSPSAFSAKVPVLQNVLLSSTHELWICGEKTCYLRLSSSSFHSVRLADTRWNQASKKVSKQILANVFPK